MVCLMDDIPVYGKTQDEHDERLLKVLQRLETAGITLHRVLKGPGQVSLQDY